MVVSLSSDKAVWDAVLNNEVVKELRGSICQGLSLKDVHTICKLVQVASLSLSLSLSSHVWA